MVHVLGMETTVWVCYNQPTMTFTVELHVLLPGV